MVAIGYVRRPCSRSFETGFTVSSTLSAKPIACLAVRKPISPSDGYVLAGLGDDREDVGDLLAAAREEVLPVGRHRGAEGLGRTPRSIQKIRLARSGARLDRRKPAFVRVRERAVVGGNY